MTLERKLEHTYEEPVTSEAPFTLARCGDEPAWATVSFEVVVVG